MVHHVRRCLPKVYPGYEILAFWSSLFTCWKINKHDKVYSSLMSLIHES